MSNSDHAGAPAPRTFRLLALAAAKLELLAYVAGQVLRFGSTLVLSRLLFPEDFGLSVIVGLVGQGLFMLSNVGVGQSITQNPRGDDTLFLNTAWSILAIRGVLIWLVACALAWPMAHLLEQPELRALIAVGSLSVLIQGFSSTSIHTLRRRLHVRPLVLLEVGTQLLTLVVNVVLAWTLKSVWALIIGTLVGATFNVWISHRLKVGYRNRFQWDHDAWRSIFGYGRWIQASSALYFFSSQADRFLIAHYIGVASLGVYSMAQMMADSISTAVLKVTHGVLFPVLSRINLEAPESLPDAYYRFRLRMDPLTMLPLAAIAAGSHLIVGLLFDDRYAEAGWILQLLCIKSALVCLLSPPNIYLQAIGQTRQNFYQDVARAIWILPGIPIGWYLGGLPGIVWVVALSELPVMAVSWNSMARHGQLRLSRELLGPAIFIAGFGLISFGLTMLRA